MQSFASGALQRKFAKKEGSWAFMQPILSSKVSMYNSLLLFCCKNHLFCAPMFPHRYCLVTLETGEESQMRESLAGTAWPELERDKKRILADHKWLRGKWRLHERREVRWANIVRRRGLGVCFVPDTMCESFMAGLIYCPMKQINGEEMNWAAAKILQWLANWELGTATQRRWMWVLQLWWWSLSCKL